jgi:S-formylglutathione hydrolase FrmB
VLSLTVALLLAGIAARPHGDVRSERFFSPALGVWKRYIVYLPPSYRSEARRRYPVAYYLHGYSGNESDWLSRADIAGVMDSLVADGLPEMILVLPDGDNGWYVNWAVPQDATACAADSTLAEAVETYCVLHDRYADYISHDLVAVVDAAYRTLADRAHRGIAGLSMGGYGAITLALTHPDEFAAAASHSGVLSPFYAGPHPFAGTPRYYPSADSAASAWGARRQWSMIAPMVGRDTAGWWERDPTRLARRLVTRGVELPALFFDVGRDDFWADANRAFHAELGALGVAHVYTEWPGAHTWRYWHAHVGESLAWLASRIGR